MDAMLRSALFVPGDRPERFAKALACGADAVIVDFEDAVKAEQKAQARERLRMYLDGDPHARVWARVNMAGSLEHEADLEACRHAGVVGILLPKAESAAQVAHVSAVGKPVIPMIESAVGLAALTAIATANGVDRLTYGGLDLGLDLGLAAGTSGAGRLLDQVRFALVVQSRLAGLMPPLETVYPALDDGPGLARFARDANDMGFAGMLCLHPRQVVEVHAALAPSATDLDWARRVLAADTGAGAYQVDGQMIDMPVIARARRLLAMGGL
jgi:(S)-citramalyl-CoA lyase